MLQAPNLLDLFANNRKDAQAKAAQSNAADAKVQAAARAGSSNLLPIDTTAKGKEAASTHSSFHSKVKESRAKLAARSQKPVQQNRTPDVRTDNPAAKAGSLREESKRVERADRVDRDERADRADRADRSERVNQSRSAAGKSRDSSNADAADKPESRPEGSRADQKITQDQNDKPMLNRGDAASDADLKQSLAEAGIHASDEQLQDPAMLAEILSMLQGMFLQQGLNLEVPPDATATAGLDVITDESEMTDLPAPTADGKDPMRNPADLSAMGKDVFALIQEKIAQLSQESAESRDNVAGPQTSPTNTPAGWQGIKVRPQTESISIDPMPMADLDRLRVLQASALQAAASGKETEITSMELPGDEGNPDAIPESGLGGIGEAGYESSGEDDAQAQADLFGRNGDKAGNAEAAASKDGPLVAKDGATGPVFHNAMEQAKSVEHRAGIERAWEPRHAQNAEVMNQIAKKLSANGLKNGDEISVQLSPEHLGKVRVSLEMKDGAMAARISVESDAVRLQVEAGLATLRDSLESQGIKLQGLEVSVDQRQSSLFNPDGSNSESFFHRNGRGRAGTEGAAENIPFESAPESDTGRRMGYNTMEYIG